MTAETNLRAFLTMIGKAEGADYNTLFGGGTFDSFDDHPRQVVMAGKYSSSAAGKYQILARTWDDFIAAKGPHKFDEAGQDACAMWLIERRDAADDVIDGRVERAIRKCGAEWASLPGAPYGQPTRTFDFCLKHYTKNGGGL